MKKFILPILLFSLTACKQQPMGEAKTFTLDDFKSVELKASDATVYQNDDLLIGRPSLIKYHPDGYILLADRKPEGLVTAIDMQTNRINHYVKQGRGPLEAISVKDLTIKDGDIWLSSPNDKKLLRLEGLPAQRSFSIKQEGKVEGNVLHAVPYRENNILTMSLGSSTDRFYLLDAERKIIDTVGVMPSVDMSDLTLNNGIYQSSISVSPDSKNVVAACTMYEVIDIYDESMALRCSLRGPLGVNSVAVKKDIGYGYVITYKPYWLTFSRVVSNNDGFWVGLIGMDIQKDEDLGQTGISKILSFDWDGKPQKAYNLPEKISTFDIDAKSKKLYAITEEAEPRIVIYNL